MWNDPELYDLENADDPAFDVPFWSSVVHACAPRRILELACGTGRLTLPLARLSVAEEVVGVDASAPFLARARERLAGEPSDVQRRVRFVEGDMREVAVEGPFDLVLVPFNSLAYLATREDRLRALAGIRGLLRPGGRFGFDLLQPRYEFLFEASQPCPPLRVDADHAAPDHGVTRFLRSYTDRYDAASQTLTSTNRYQIHHADGRVEHRVTDLDWHIYFPEELELLLAATGFTVAERFGGYAREPWTDRSRQFLWLCEPR
jgi:SAM-dependent methyltransferase